MFVTLKMKGCKASKVTVSSLQEASRVVQKFISEKGIGASQWQGGSVQDGNKQIARISYNGKVWPPGPWREDAKPLMEAALPSDVPQE